MTFCQQFSSRLLTQWLWQIELCIESLGAIVVPVVRVPRAIPAAVASHTLAYPHKQSPGLANRKKNNFDRNSLRPNTSPLP